jgi:serine/threonine-protein kinase RsbW
MGVGSDLAGIEFFITEKIKVVIPSRLQYVDPLTSYLADHLVRLGYIDPDSNTSMALHEALTNAIRHGNRLDASKKVTVEVAIDPHEAVFTITDEGHGFDPAEVGDPTEGDNIFREGGRGLLMIRHLMDEVRYNRRGNRVTLIKKRPRVGET